MNQLNRMKSVESTIQHNLNDGNVITSGYSGRFIMQVSSESEFLTLLDCVCSQENEFRTTGEAESCFYFEPKNRFFEGGGGGFKAFVYHTVMSCEISCINASGLLWPGDGSVG